jgi:hypothetical protein
LKPADAEALIHCALLVAFTLPHAPVTQLGIIKWVGEAGRLSKIHSSAMDAAINSVSRWSGKWQNALRNEVPELPEQLLSTLKAPIPKEAEQPKQQDQRPGRQGDRGRRPAPAAVETDADADADSASPEGARVETEEPDAEPAEAAPVAKTSEADLLAESEEPPQSKQRPVYESKTVPRKPHAPPTPRAQQQPTPPSGAPAKAGAGARDLSVPELLRAVEAQFHSIRSELQKSEAKLRQRDEDLRRSHKRPEKAAVPVIEGEPTPDELARLNRQLENRNVELQARIEELTADAEARAVSVGAVTDQPVDDPNAQLRTLFVLKLQEDFDDFVALEKESPDIVVQQHYRTVLRHVFEVLTQEGVRFEQPVSAH